MRTNPLKFRCPIALDDLLVKRATEAGYRTKTEYLVGLIRYDLLTRKPHTATAGISELSRAEQDRIDDEIARMFQSGETLNGSWFEHRVKEAAAAANLPVQRVIDTLLQRIKHQ